MARLLLQPDRSALPHQSWLRTAVARRCYSAFRQPRDPFPLAASAGQREDGIAKLRAQAAAAPKGPPPPGKLWNGPPKGSGADKCTVSKACATGAGLKWDAAALGVKAAEKRKFFKTPTYANSDK